MKTFHRVPWDGDPHGSPIAHGPVPHLRRSHLVRKACKHGDVPHMFGAPSGDVARACPGQRLGRGRKFVGVCDTPSGITVRTGLRGFAGRNLGRSASRDARGWRDAQPAWCDGGRRLRRLRRGPGADRIRAKSSVTDAPIGAEFDLHCHIGRRFVEEYDGPRDLQGIPAHG